MGQNPELQMTLDTAVKEVLLLLTGLNLSYQPELDRYGAITGTLNRAMRSVALEKEWSWFADLQEAGTSREGDVEIVLPSSLRPRVVGKDAVRFVRPEDGRTVKWAYFLPRDAGADYPVRTGLWVTHTRQSLLFSRPLNSFEADLTIMVPVMREPRMFRLPEQPEDSEAPLVSVPDSIRKQLVDFWYPDLVVLRAAYFYAQTDPVMQPRVQTLEQQYKDLMYQLIERDDRNTDSPFMNEFLLPVQSGLWPDGEPNLSYHPHSDERR